MSTAQTSFETDAPLAMLTFTRPEARNAMTWEMYDALVDACDRVDRDPSLRVLVLQRVTKPTIAAVQGVAAGGGCAIALCCDLRVATPDAAFGVPIARTLGNCLSADTCNRMISLLGPARFKEIMFTGRFVPAAEAHALGLVNRIVDAAEIDRAVGELAAAVAANAPLTIRAVKELTRRLIARQRLAPGEDRDVIEMCYTSNDFKEGVAAFLSKRHPRWTGT